MAKMSVAAMMAINRHIGRGCDSLGKPRAFTDQEFFEISDEMGWNQRDQDYRNLHEHLALWVKNTLPIASALEFGSGPGYLLYCLNKVGVDSVGVDGNESSRTFFVEQHPEFEGKYFLDPRFEKKYDRADAVVTIETLEHIPDHGIYNILDKIRTQIRPKYIVFSSTPYADPNPGWDLQWGHINIKQPPQWRALFGQYGYHLTTVQPPVTPWASLYVDPKEIT